jgi:hypothetical protein
MPKRANRRTLVLPLTILVFAASLAGCAASSEEPDYVPLLRSDAIRWPSIRTPLPPCDAAQAAYFAASVSPPAGSIAFLPGTVHEPVGHDVRIDIEVRSTQTGELDTAARGPLTFELGPDVAMSAPSLVAGGKARTVVRLAAPGLHRMRAFLEDGRSGVVEIMGYETKLPVWELTGDDDQLATVMAKPGEDLRTQVVLTLENVAYPASVRLHGGSSRYYPKQSLRIDLAPGVTLPDGSDNLILRSEWNDKTLLRNFLAVESFRNGTWLPTFGVEHVHLRINQRYYGVMLHTQRIDRDFLRQHGLSTTASLYEADPPLEASVPGGNLTPLSREKYPIVYQHHAGTVPYDDLIELIEAKLTLPEKDFVRAIEGTIAAEDYLAYLAAMAVIQNHDHIRKNYYLYRDASTDTRWRVFPWDLDLSWGHLYTDEADVRDERIFTNENLFFGEKVPTHDFYNQLLTRTLAVPSYRTAFAEFVQYIAANVLDEAFVNGRIENVLCRASPDILADTKKRATNDEYLARVDEIRQFVRDRRSFIQAQR